MYADDGLVLREKDSDDKEMKKWFAQLKSSHVNVDPKKSGEVKDRFKFLGVEFDLEKEEVKYKDSTYS